MSVNGHRQPPTARPQQAILLVASALSVRKRRTAEARVKSSHIGLIVAVGALLLAGLGIASSYNQLITLDQAVDAQWGQVQNAYQRRADLVPNLVETVKGAAAFEKETFTAVAEARAKAGQVNVTTSAASAEGLAEFQQAQGQLSNALSRLLVVAERYPDLKANANFRDLQAQLEGTENRIAVERMRFNDAAQAFNTVRQRFPTTLIASLFGDRFRPRPYFQAQPAAAEPPRVRFTP